MKTISHVMLSMFFILMGCKEHQENASSSNVVKPAERVLFIVSNAHFYGATDIETSNHFAELVYAYDVFVKAGYAINFVSPQGGAIPVGYINTSDTLQKKYLYDNDFMDALEHTQKPETLKATDYKAVYYGGGGAAMFGVADNEPIQKIVMELYEKHRGVVSAICHGTAGIVNLKKQDGTYLFAGKKVNGFPDIFERKDAAYYQTFPFSIQATIQERGGDFLFSEKGWDGFYQADGRLITGQDPTAAAKVAQMVVKKLKQV